MKRQERIDRIELMRTYIRIVEAGSLSAAAGQMETTQATVSRRLQSLEGLLGVKLILRTTHAMKLTDDGERCYRARQVVDAWLALEDDLRIADDRPVGCCGCGRRTLWSAAAAGAAGRLSAALSAAVGGVDAE
jgi:DNA-binding transcriptional LysR family regulator